MSLSLHLYTPDRFVVQPESQALLLCRRMHGSSRCATSPPYQRAPPIGQHPPTPRQSQPGLDWPSGVPGNARGADAHFWAGPPPPRPSVVGRDGLAIGRFRRFPKPPAVILYLRPPPPPVNNHDHPPSTTAITPPSEVGPVVARAEFGSQSSPGHNTHPSKVHTYIGGLHLPQQRTPIGGLHLLRLEHITLHRSLLSGSHFSPKLKCCHSNTTPSSRLPPAGRSGRCKYRLWAAHAVAH